MGFDVPAPEFVANEPAWARAIAFAGTLQATVPFAARVLNAPWVSRLPSTTHQELERLERRGRMSLALLDAELQAAIDALSAAQVPVMLIKGADVGRRFYPDRILRPMGDVDLLVPAEQYTRAWEALQASGFAPTERRYDHCFRSALARSGECPSVDLHFSLIETDTPARMRKLWERSEAKRFSDLAGEVRVLSPEDCLVYVLRHSAVLHVLEEPGWLSDLHFIVISAQNSGRPIDWSLVERELVETRSQASAWFVFRVLARCWGTPIPREVLDRLAGRVGWLRKLSASRHGELESWFPVNGRSRLWMLRSRYLLRDSFADSARYAVRRWRRKRREREADKAWPSNC